MSRATREKSPRSSHHRTSFIGLILLGVLAALIVLEPHWITRIRSAWFDGYQVIKPRVIVSNPVTVVQIDDKSIARLGQWPWPRTVLADLIRNILRQQPLAIGVGILMPEPDRLSPDRVLAGPRQRDAVLASRLDELPSNDRELARAIAEGPVVLAVAATPERSEHPVRAPPFIVVDRTGSSAASSAGANLPRHAGALTNIDEIDRAAKGHGLISAGPSDDVIRRVPLAVRIDDRLVPSLPLEMLRVALQAAAVRMFVDGASIETLAVGDFVVPSEDDGQLRVYYSARDARRYVSAIDVLEGRIDASRLRQKLVLIGTTGLALVDYQNTPLGVRMPGSEIHAQVLENLFDQTWLTRPARAPMFEAAALVVLGLLLIWATPRWRPGYAALLALACIFLLVAVGLGAFVARRLVFDVATPALGLMLVFSVLLLLTLGEASRQRRRLERVVRQQREQAAYTNGELQAAKLIQTGFLPREDFLRDDPRIEVAAFMVPAREVGGDLYDYFLLDDHRLFFMVGDVAGKGLSASMFMAVSKALCKSTALRSAGRTISDMIRISNDEISRDNPEMFFVTAFAGVLDLHSGELAYCNAGHVNPYLLDGDSARHDGAQADSARSVCVDAARPANESSPCRDTLRGSDDSNSDVDIARLSDAAGPPLCTVDGFPYVHARKQMRPGELLCLVTDGVVDAQEATGERYGSERLQQLLLRTQADGKGAHETVQWLRDDVLRFVGAADASDDITVMALRWRGRG